MNDDVKKALEANVAETLRDGPRLTYTKQIVVLGRDRTKKRVLFGGLGAMGVGQMWSNEGEEERCSGRPGFEDAPEIEFGGSTDPFLNSKSY